MYTMKTARWYHIPGIILFMCGLMLPGMPLFAAPEDPEMVSTVSTAEVLAIVSQSPSTIPGTDTIRQEQILRAEILEGPEKGQIVEVRNDYVAVRAGDRFLLVKQSYPEGTSAYFLQDVDRRKSLLVISVIGAAIVILLAGWVGIRSLLALGASLAGIILVLLPLLLKGYPPVWTAVIVAALILGGVMYFTHSWNRVTHAAFLGTALTIMLTGIFASIAVWAARLSGFSAEESVYLNISTSGALDMQGLLLAAIIIGVLGILDDIAITQAATVAELRHANPGLSKKELYRRAMAVGKEHVGALVNTLALAYAGASLPLLLLISRLDTPIGILINQEIFATEIIRTVVGTAALTLAVPLSTLFAIWLRADAKAEGGHHH